MKKSSFTSILILACFTGLLLGGCKEQEQAKAPPPPPPEVTIAKPSVQDVTNYKYFTGYTSARESVELRARVEGYLESFSFKPGQLVKKNDLLFSIDPKPFEADVEKAKANLETRKAERNLADATLQRKDSAYKQKAVSELAVLEARAQLSKTNAQVKEAEANLVSAQLQLSYTKIHAPVGGRISRNLVDEGNLVGAGGDKTLLATLVNYDPVHVYFYMDERTLLLFKTHLRDEGKDLSKGPVEVDLALEGETGYPHIGVGDYLSNEMDLSTGTIMVRAKFDNKDLYIIPGLYAKIRIPIGVKKNALLVPEIALSSDQRGRYLLAASADGTVEYKAVETGPLVDGKRVIRKGIEKDDNIIVNGIQRARPGAKVTAKMKAVSKPAALNN